MITILSQADFNRTEVDMWSILVENAILSGKLPQGTDPDDVESVTVEIVEAE